MKKFAMVAVCTFCVVGYALGAEYNMTLKSIEGGYLVGTKKKAGAVKGDAPEDVKVKLSTKVEVFKGKADPDKKGNVLIDGDADKAGLKSLLIVGDDGKIAEKGKNIRVITEGEGDKEVVTKIIVTAGGKKGKGGQ